MARTYNGSKDEIVIKQKVDPNVITQVRTYKLITPLFGGGAETKKPDAVTTVRATEVSGHLRFWWRATRGGNLEFDGDLNKMKKREEEIWGSAAQKDKVGHSEVKVAILKASKDRELKTQKVKDKILHISDPRTDWGYISFPLKEDKEKNKPAGSVWEIVNFELEISYPKNLEEEIEPALWGWETFGGIGGRTRRGFGALKLEGKIVNGQEVSFSLPSYENAEQEIKDRLKTFSGKWPEKVPHLNSEKKVKVTKVTSAQANEVWRGLITKYQNFRQKRHKRLGKSLWPEANELRRRLGIGMNWKPDEVKDAKLVKKFPRAEFGLPILLHLPHDGDMTFTIQGKPDPKTGKKYERLSSVLILKPVACANDKAVGIALVLDAPVMPPNGLEIKEPMDNKDPVEWELTKDDVKTNPLNQVMGNDTDVIEAFFKTLK